MTGSGAEEPLTMAAAGPLAGTARVPGDKSVSHRALMLAALAVGTSRISGLLEGEDVLATAAALAAMGARVRREAPGDWLVDGTGVGALLQPAAALDMGNSGTSTRLLMGLVATHAIEATFVGDASLSRRPMRRVVEPLAQTGADIRTAPGGRLPLSVRGMVPGLPVRWRLPVPSAQVKSAILLAALNVPGETVVEEPAPTRDHSERMLAAAGAQLDIAPMADGGRRIALLGPATLRPMKFAVPGDPSAAAFLAVAATIVPDSDVLVPGVGMNPGRDGLFRLLDAMGARIERLNPRMLGGEPVADLRIRAAPLRAVDPPPEWAPSMIDEFPVAFVAAALAAGRSVFRGLDELRVKESDRIRTMAEGLAACGVAVEELPDGLVVHGRAGTVKGGATIAARLDHRIAMSFAVLSLATERPVTVDDRRPIATSWPGFAEALEALGAEQR